MQAPTPLQAAERGSGALGWRLVAGAGCVAGGWVAADLQLGLRSGFPSGWGTKARVLRSREGTGMEKRVEDVGRGDVGPGAACPLFAGQVTPAQVTAPGARPVQGTFKSRPSLLVRIRTWEMGRARDAPEVLTSLTANNCLLA